MFQSFHEDLALGDHFLRQKSFGFGTVPLPGGSTTGEDDANLLAFFSLLDGPHLLRVQSSDGQGCSSSSSKSKSRSELIQLRRAHTNITNQISRIIHPGQRTVPFHYLPRNQKDFSCSRFAHSL